MINIYFDIVNVLVKYGLASRDLTDKFFPLNVTWHNENTQCISKI